MISSVGQMCLLSINATDIIFQVLTVHVYCLGNNTLMLWWSCHREMLTFLPLRALQCAHFTRICERMFRRANEKNKTGARVRVTSPQRTILCVHTKREGTKRFHIKQRFHLQRDTFARHGRARSRGFQVDLQHATFARVETLPRHSRDDSQSAFNSVATEWRA